MQKSPSINPNVLINKYLEMVKCVIPEAFALLEAESNPVLFCYSVALSESEQSSPSVEYLAHHILLPVKSKNDGDSQQYLTANGFFKITLVGNTLQYMSSDLTICDKVFIIERTIVYDSNYNSVEVLFLEKSLLPQFDQVLPDVEQRNLSYYMDFTALDFDDLNHHSESYAAQLIEEEIKNHLQHKSGAEQKIISQDYMAQIYGVTNKFLSEFQRFFRVESIKFSESPSMQLQCLVWASERLSAIQHQTLLSIISCVSDYPNLTVSCFSHLYQPMEE